jgi:sigma-E factor negative regulatory protein RseB
LNWVRHALLCGGAAILMLLGTAVHAQSVTDWLRKMNRAADELSYRGTFVYVHDNQIETMRVVRRTGNGITQERLFALNGAAREILRDQHRVWCFLPDKKMGVHQYRQASDKTFPRILPRDIDELVENYSLELGAHERVADRDTQVVKIVPQDEYRYGYNLYVDHSTGLLLRAELLDPQGTPIEQYMFAEIDIGGVIGDNQLEPRTPRADLVWVGDQTDEQPVASSDLRWVVNDVPNGFMLSRHFRRLSPMRNQPVEHLVYSDGLAAVSIFVEKKMSDSQSEIRGLSRMGAVHAFGTMVNDYQITVVGEVPGATVDRMGMSVAMK